MQEPGCLTSDELLTKYRHAASPHFDPRKHLKKIGLANQTTMYKKETQVRLHAMDQAHYWIRFCTSDPVLHTGSDSAPDPTPIPPPPALEHTPKIHFVQTHPSSRALLEQAIGKLFEQTMMAAFGPENIKSRFAAFNTICDATQVAKCPACDPSGI